MTVKQTIEKAIEGGYKDEKSHCYRCGIRKSATKALMLGCSNSKEVPYKSHLFRKPSNKIEVYLLDPNFWKCLGKAMGWKEGEIKVCVGCGKSLDEKEVSAWGKHTGKYNGREMDGCDSDVWHYHRGVWEIEWHKFIDHLAEGGNIVDYFEKLN